MASVNEKRFFIKIEAGPKAGGNPCTYHNTGFPFHIFMKWKWYFEYRAAVLKVNNPRHTVTLLTGSYDYTPPRDVVIKELKNKLAGKKRTISKYTNLLQLAEQQWNKLFPISEDVLYIKAADKIDRLKNELEQLEIQLRDYEANINQSFPYYFFMIITWMNYKTLLPESLHEKFKSLADRGFGRPIIYTNQVLRYATVEEA